MEEFGHAKLEWLSRFLRLPNGIPSHDTFGRVFSRLDPEQFGACFMDWVKSIAELTQGQVVAVEGKTPRGCHDRARGRPALHLVSAWASQNHVVLGQALTSAHSNEITAIPQLLSLLDLNGCIITIDAMGSQKGIARQIVDGGSEYLLAVKSNQGELYGNIKDVFECAAREGTLGVEHCHHKQVSKGHGRLESRECWVITDRDELAYVGPQGQWPGLKGIAKINYRRNGNEESPTDTRCYICSYGPWLNPCYRPPGTTGASRTASTAYIGSWTWPLMNTAAGSAGQDRPRRPEPGSGAALDPKPAQAGTHGQSRYQGQPEKGRLGLSLSAQSPLTLICDRLNMRSPCPDRQAGGLPGAEERRLHRVG